MRNLDLGYGPAWTSDYLYLWFILIMNASKICGKNDQGPGDN